MQKLKYKLTYLKRVVWHFFGFCPKCHNRVNYTTSGRPICPNCGH